MSLNNCQIGLLHGFYFFEMHSVVEIKIFFNIMCVVHYSLISHAFPTTSLRGLLTFDLLCDLT
jgi:hypothetical protein